MPDRLDTIVVGAGVSGLAYAHARGASANLLILEASARAGGLVHTDRGGPDGQYRFERGPEALRYEQGELSAMLGELGLEAKKPPPEAAKRFLVCDGKLVPAPLKPMQLLRSPLLSVFGKLRLLCEPLRSRRRGLEGSIADFVRHRLGREVLEAMIDPLVSGIHAGDPEDLSMRVCFPRLVELVESHGSLIRALGKTKGSPAPETMKPKGGTSAITDALASRLRDKLRKEQEVTAIARTATGWRVETKDAACESRRVVLAVPAAAAARLLKPVNAEMARAIASIPTENVVSVVHTYDRAAVAHPLDGFGYLVPSRERLVHLGTLFSSSLAPEFAPPGRVVLRTFLGGARHPEAVDKDDSILMGCIAKEVGALLGLAAPPLWSQIQRWRGVFPRFDLSHRQRLSTIEEDIPSGLSLLGNWLRGIGVNHLVSAARGLARAHAKS